MADLFSLTLEADVILNGYVSINIDRILYNSLYAMSISTDVHLSTGLLSRSECLWSFFCFISSRCWIFWKESHSMRSTSNDRWIKKVLLLKTHPSHWLSSRQTVNVCSVIWTLPVMIVFRFIIVYTSVQCKYSCMMILDCTTMDTLPFGQTQNLRNQISGTLILLFCGFFWVMSWLVHWLVG